MSDVEIKVVSYSGRGVVEKESLKKKYQGLFYNMERFKQLKTDGLKGLLNTVGIDSDDLKKYSIDFRGQEIDVLYFSEELNIEDFQYEDDSSLAVFLKNTEVEIEYKDGSEFKGELGEDFSPYNGIKATKLDNGAIEQTQYSEGKKTKQVIKEKISDKICRTEKAFKENESIDASKVKFEVVGGAGIIYSNNNPKTIDVMFNGKVIKEGVKVKETFEELKSFIVSLDVHHRHYQVTDAIAERCKSGLEVGVT